MTGRCEHCEASSELQDCRRGGVKLALCRLCRRIDVIGRWRMEVQG